MLAVVRIALSRPYTFVVMAMLIVIFGVTAAIKTPTDIFPNIGIPVVAVVWTYNGLPPDDMSGRVIYYYERTLSAQVNDIEHIESQSLAGYGVVKIFFQPNVNINSALAQITAASQTVLKLLPAGITPPYVLSFNASSVPILQLALSSDSLSQAEIFDAGQNFIRPQLATVGGAAVPSPYGGKVLQVLILLGLKMSPGREGNDAIDADGNEYELKTVNRALNARAGITTHHHLNRDILRKYRSVRAWYVAIYEGIELMEIYRIAPADLEPKFREWEQKIESTGVQINNPKIPMRLIRAGERVYPPIEHNPPDPPVTQ